jgi:hypothetical protein
MQNPRGRHRLRRAQTSGLLGLFISGLGRTHVDADCRQYFFRVVPQLPFAHPCARRHQGLGEDREFANDFLVMVVDESAEGHLLSPPGVDVLVTGLMATSSP